MIRFKSIISRIVILHVIAVAIASILMSLALSWLLNIATNNIHNEAMEEQAASVAQHLVLRPDRSLALELPPSLVADREPAAPIAKKTRSRHTKSLRQVAKANSQSNRESICSALKV